MSDDDGDDKNRSIEDFGIPVDWDPVCLDYSHFEEFHFEWCEQQGWNYGTDFIATLMTGHPYKSEWGEFDIGKDPVIYYFFKNPKHATIFRLRWS